MLALPGAPPESGHSAYLCRFCNYKQRPETPRLRLRIRRSQVRVLPSAPFLSAWRSSKQAHPTHFIATTLRVGAFSHRVSDAEVLAHAEGGHMVVGRGREEAVHVLFFEARVIESARGGLPDQVERSEAGAHLPEVRLGHPGDSRPSAQAHPSPIFSTGTKTAASSPSSLRTANTTSIPTSTSSTGTPSIRLIILKPSSRSTRATLWGSRSL